MSHVTTIETPHRDTRTWDPQELGRDLEALGYMTRWWWRPKADRRPGSLEFQPPMGTSASRIETTKRINATGSLAMLRGLHRGSEPCAIPR